MIVTTWGGAAWATAGDGFHNIGHTEQPGLLLVMVDTASATGSKQPGLLLVMDVAASATLSNPGCCG